MKTINLIAVTDPAGLSCGYIVTAGAQFDAVDFATKMLSDECEPCLIPTDDIREMQKAIDLSHTAVGIVGVYAA